ncbi:uncharacterized protein EAE98_009787 [Botrytis deweyae]|uniref:FAD/NAD(P)-binding domain-containing protein n=1 Tax=Botrytis deweyae TaxID=2478750 RepID=A0ABQ7IAZ1_9HELO|nr:uncharacterized protein EAE98_009787 [Botrytis deweyae]KAF7918544.1 hypothetical protein EAE98_009787 [Botrytis deweyae]
MTTTFDVLIIGGGPAGLSTAASIVRQSHPTLIIDSGKYRNKDSYMHTVPTWDHAKAGDFRAAARKDFERYNTVQIEDGEVSTVNKTEAGLFQATCTNGKVFEAHKLVLATGIVDVLPKIEGYAECWATGIFHCLYCHGWEERDVPSSGILAEGEIANVVVSLHVARQALRLSKETTIYTLGNEKLAIDITAATATAPTMKVDSRPIKKLTKGSERAEVIIHFEDGTTKVEGYLVHKPKTVLRGDLAQQLGLDLTPQNTIKVNPPFNQTSVKGVFAAGDAANPMQTVTQAIFSGTVCGGGAPLQLQAETYGQKGLF